MKPYNPFKPHIVEYEDEWFTVRKLPWYFMFSVIDYQPWIYKDVNGEWYSHPYNMVRSIEKAKERLNYKKPPKFKPKVYIV